MFGIFKAVVLAVLTIAASVSIGLPDLAQAQAQASTGPASPATPNAVYWCNDGTQVTYKASCKNYGGCCQLVSARSNQPHLDATVANKTGTTTGKLAAPGNGANGKANAMSSGPGYPCPPGCVCTDKLADCKGQSALPRAKTDNPAKTTPDGTRNAMEKVPGEECGARPTIDCISKGHIKGQD